ncbi:uncharacterized protein LOC134272634, partial [Saccostrea cucullata]|uniref:uncharacterized protein LOC134272634 n=1 Tax=Saccostrea cuccullata TaxID=36930 RepID=UPI002ED1F623
MLPNKRKSDIAEIKTKVLNALDEKESEINQTISELEENITNLKEILDYDDVSLLSTYISRNAEIRRLPPKVNVSLPSFSPHQNNTEHLHQMFGSLSALSVTTEEHGYTMKTHKAVSFTPVKPLLDKPEVITTIHTEFGLLNSVTCLSDEEIWTCGNNKIMKLYNLQGKLLKSIQTKSGDSPWNIAVTRSGDLIYTDPVTRTVNIVKNDQIQEVITLQGWTSHCVCCVSSGDLDIIKYISENRNLDICVADNGTKAVVVVNQEGKLRFRYTGHPSTTKKSFHPRGITTDRQSQILTVDRNYNCIHILDQDGQFLCYIDNCDLNYPSSICVDTRDNLFVAELYS